MAIPSVFQTSVDFTALTPCVQQSDLNTGFNTISFRSGFGGIVQSPTAPNVATYPEFAAFLWAQTSGGNNTGQFYFYDGTSWLPYNLYNGALINNHSIPLVKLVNGAPLQVVQMAADGSTAQWVNVSSLFSAGTVAITALTPSAAGTYILESNGTSNSWTSAATLITQLTPFPITNLVPASAATNGSILFTNAAGDTISWTTSLNGSFITTGTLAVTALPPASTNNYVLTTIAGAVQWAPPPDTFTSAKYTSADIALPAAGSGTTAVNAHGLGAIPSFFQAKLRCVTGELGYSAGDVIDINALTLHGANGNGDSIDTPAIAVKVDATNVTVIFCGPIQSFAGTGYKLSGQTNAGAYPITPSNWRVFVTVIK